MFLLILNEFDRIVGKDNLRAEFIEKPYLGFEYDFIKCDSVQNIKIINNQVSTLTDIEIENVKTFCDNYPFIVYEIDDNFCLVGETTVHLCKGNYAHCLPPKLDGYFFYNLETQNWDYVYGVDAEGNYLGNVHPSQCAFFANGPRHAGSYFKWDPVKKEWYDSRTLEDFKILWLLNIDDLHTATLNNGVLFKGVAWNNTQTNVESLMNSTTANHYLDTAGTSVNFDGFTIDDLKQAIIIYNKNLDDYFDSLKKKVNLANTIEEVKSIKVSL